MTAQAPQNGTSFAGHLLLTGFLLWLQTKIGPSVVENEIRPLATLVALWAFFCLLGLLIRLLEFAVRFLQWLSTRTPTGKNGTAAWAKIKELKSEFNRKNQGPFWGIYVGWRRKPLFFDYVSNAMTLAPAGSGKGVCTVTPMGMSIHHSKIFADFKGELICMLKKPLEERGEINRVLNPGRLWGDMIGVGDTLNPLDIIADDLNRPGSLRDVMDDLRETSSQILQEPSERDSENTYFREGSRRIMADAILMETMIEEYDATLSSVAMLIEDRTRLEEHVRWVVGVDRKGSSLPEGPFPIERAPWAKNHSPEDVKDFARLVRARAHNLLELMRGDDTRTFESFITGAQQALAPFAFGRMASCLTRSSFRISDIKDSKTPTNLFIVADASRMESSKTFIGLIQWCCMTTIKRHENKERPVYFILDEATNYRIAGLENLLTWGRAYGLRLHVILQDLAAFERVYGKTAVDTLLSETEIKQFLPGQRSPKTLELISKKLLGEQSIISANMALTANEFDVRESLSESGRSLMTEDELRRTKHGILFVRRNRPILFNPVSYAEVHPWRNQVGINPFYGKPFRKRVKLRL